MIFKSLQFPEACFLTCVS